VGDSIKHFLLALWRGQLPLARVFWLHAVVYGTLANLFATLATFAALSAGVPGALAAVIHFLPLPYNIAATVGVWRSADRYRGLPLWAALARVLVILWAIAATLA
jgi:hypothetical protein